MKSTLTKSSFKYLYFGVLFCFILVAKVVFIPLYSKYIPPNFSSCSLLQMCGDRLLVGTGWILRSDLQQGGYIIIQPGYASAMSISHLLV